ncbi:MAG: methyltransferase domain-containing protein [Polyangia bacterium]
MECGDCGHLLAAHAPLPAEAAAGDYHLSYDQEGFLSSLATTRKRQADRILATLERVSSARSLFDFGCGRGWFLETAQRRGFRPIGGGDVSALAVALLRKRNVPAVTLNGSGVLTPIDFQELGFIPEIITFLDVIEHFDGDLSGQMGEWLASLPKTVAFIVFKVPLREGAVFAAASLARRVGVPGPARQLFQTGTSPPHLQYFSRDSLDRFVRAVGLRTVKVFDDLDFEVDSLTTRAADLKYFPRPMVSVAGAALAAVARRVGRLDTRVIIAAR